MKLNNFKQHQLLFMTARFLYVFMLCSFLSNAQTHTIDSLKLVLKAKITSEKRIQAIFAICEERASLSGDTLYHYAILAKDLAKKSADQNKVFLADYYLALSLQQKGFVDSSLKIIEHRLRIISPDKYDLHQKFISAKARAFLKNGNYKEAINLNYNILKNAEEHNDLLTQAQSKNMIAWSYIEMQQNKEALDWLKQALHTIFPDTNNAYSIYIYSNLATTYNGLYQFDSAEYYINKAIELARKYENLTMLANAYNIQASIFLQTRRMDYAEDTLHKALQIRKKIGDPFYIVSDMFQLADYYNKNGKPDKAIAISKEGISIANKHNYIAKLILLNAMLAEGYRSLNEYENYSKTLEQLIILKDSSYKHNSANALAEIKNKYELQKKENIIIKQKLDIVRKNYFLYGSAGLLLISVLFALILFRSYGKKQKMKLNFLLDEEKQHAVYAVKEAEENERKRIAADLHDNLGAYAASIKSNVDHVLEQGSGHQQALQELRANSQIIVSQLNDTIWVLKKESISLTAISDRIKMFLQRLQPSYPSVKMEAHENIEQDIMLSSSHAFHLFSIVQEAVNNALRHSGCSEVDVFIKNNTDWLISIEDNGSGFHGSINKTQGNGLLNMKNRAEICSWDIERNHKIPHGTLVIIQPK